MSDPDTKFSTSIGWTQGERTARYAMVIDHGKVVYAEKEPSGGEVSVSHSRGRIVVTTLDKLTIHRCPEPTQYWPSFERVHDLIVYLFIQVNVRMIYSRIISVASAVELDIEHRRICSFRSGFLPCYSTSLFGRDGSRQSRSTRVHQIFRQ